MDLCSQTESEKKITTSNGDESKRDENQQESPHPMASSDAEGADSLVGRVD
jgi:hypothetical protein